MASNIRVLVSNIGDGNWGIDAAGANTDNQLSGNSTIYFPPGINKTTEPTASERFGGSIDYIGWSSKSNWMVQVLNSHGSNPGTIQVLGHRPSGVSEEVIAATVLAGAAVSVSVTQGGLGGEEIYGHFTHFTFVATTNTGELDCYVTAWNYGDILDVGGVSLER